MVFAAGTTGGIFLLMIFAAGTTGGTFLLMVFAAGTTGGTFLLMVFAAEVTGGTFLVFFSVRNFSNVHKYCVGCLGRLLRWLSGFGCAFAVTCIKFVFISGMRAGHPVQRPISDQRSLRHGTCSEQHQSATGAS